MTIIAPSLLSANFLELKNDIEKFNGLEDVWLHLDIMDGHFVPNLTFGKTVLKGLSSVTTNKLDAHLMVKNPQDYLEDFHELGVHNLTFHWEAVDHHDRIIAEAKKLFPSVGLALNPSTSVESIPPYLFQEIDLILIMTVNPGFGGQSFIDGCIQKIKQLDQIKKDHSCHFEIQVDGGVNDKNAPFLIQAGATNLVAGSYIFSEPNQDYALRVNSLR